MTLTPPDYEIGMGSTRTPPVPQPKKTKPDRHDDGLGFDDVQVFMERIFPLIKDARLPWTILAHIILIAAFVDSPVTLLGIPIEMVYRIGGGIFLFVFISLAISRRSLWWLTFTIQWAIASQAFAYPMLAVILYLVKR
jgi:hypothetical protein